MNFPTGEIIAALEAVDSTEMTAFGEMAQSHSETILPPNLNRTITIATVQAMLNIMLSITDHYPPASGALTTGSMVSVGYNRYFPSFGVEHPE